MKIFMLISLMAMLATTSHAEEKGKLLRHVVLFSWKENTPEKTITGIENAFAALPSKIKAIDSFEWGTDVSVEGLSKGFTHCFIVTFKSEKDREASLPHPDHKAFVDLIKPHMKDVLVVDFWKK